MSVVVRLRTIGPMLWVFLILSAGPVDAASFEGVIGKTAEDSVPDWPERPRPPEGAPNVLIWLMDDVGFGQPEIFGGLIETTHLEELAQSGLRFTDFHATPLCSPTRASLLTGRNPHAVGVGAHANTASGFPGYNARIPKSAAGIARILRDQGYATYALGKWDQMPAEHMSSLGPFDHWPSGQGFEHFYGFLHYDANHFEPHLWRDHTPIRDATEGDPDYHLTADLADQAIQWIHRQRSVRPEQPFLMYWATGAVHAPHHAPRAYIEKYRGQFDMGWNKARRVILERQKRLGIVPADAELPPWPANVPTWESLTKDQKRMAARAMETFAGMLDHADDQFGRILAALEAAGALENTIVIVTSDNGASGEGGITGGFNELLMGQASWEDNLAHFDEWGGLETYPHYPIGWAAAGNTPFRYYKQSAFEGGNRVPMVISWARGIEGGGLRRQFHHVSDIVPTVLDLVGIDAPEMVGGVEQQRMDGISLRYALDDAGAPTRKAVQYFELWGNHGIRADGWKANVQLRPEPWDVITPYSVAEAPWSLFHVAEDFNERNDLAAELPDKLQEMQQIFDAEAWRNNVYPIAPDYASELRGRVMAALRARDGRFVYGPESDRIPMSLAPPLTAFPFKITAEVENASAVDDGVIFAMGGVDGGFTLFLDNGRPVFAYNWHGRETRYVRGDARLPRKSTSITVDVVRNPAIAGAATVELAIDGKRHGKGDLVGVGATVPSQEMFDVGADWGSTVVPDYRPHGVMPVGVIQQVRVDLVLPSADPAGQH